MVPGKSNLRRLVAYGTNYVSYIRGENYVYDNGISYSQQLTASYVGYYHIPSR